MGVAVNGSSTLNPDDVLSRPRAGGSPLYNSGKVTRPSAHDLPEAREFQDAVSTHGSNHQDIAEQGPAPGENMTRDSALENPQKKSHR